MPTGTDVLGDQKSVPENSEMKYPRLQARIDSQPSLLTAVAPAASREFFFGNFTRKTRPCVQKSYIDFGDNFNFGELVFLASLIVGELVCRRVGLSASCP